MFIAFSAYILYFDFTKSCLKYYFLEELGNKKVLQEEIGNLMENLDECILTQSQSGINYCNIKGNNILENIQKILDKIE